MFAKHKPLCVSLIGLSLITTACGTGVTPPPAVEVRTQTVIKEVQRPCAATIPNRPTPLAKPLPTDAVRLAALLGAKLVEWAGHGGYGDRADAALRECKKASQP